MQHTGLHNKEFFITTTNNNNNNNKYLLLLQLQLTYIIIFCIEED